MDENDHDYDIDGMFVIIFLCLCNLGFEIFSFCPKNDYRLFEWAQYVKNNSVPAFCGLFPVLGRTHALWRKSRMTTVSWLKIGTATKILNGQG